MSINFGSSNFLQPFGTAGTAGLAGTAGTAGTAGLAGTVGLAGNAGNAGNAGSAFPSLAAPSNMNSMVSQLMDMLMSIMTQLMGGLGSGSAGSAGSAGNAGNAGSAGNAGNAGSAGNAGGAGSAGNQTPTSGAGSYTAYDQPASGPNCPPPTPADCPPEGTTPPDAETPPSNTPPNNTPPSNTPPGNTPPGNKPPTTTPPYQDTPNGNFWGDPHFEGFGGEKYDVMGQDGKTYNIVSDKGLQYNATFAKTDQKGDATVIKDAGITSGKDKLEYHKGGSPKLNGQEMEKGKTYNLDNNGKATWDGKQLKFSDDAYNINLSDDPKDSRALRSDVSVKGANVLKDGVTPHGLLGQTADGVAGKHKGVNNTNDKKQGGDVIDGKVTQYEVKDLFDTSFKDFNRFNG